MDGGGAIARWIELQSTTTLISPTGRVGYGRVDCAGMACGFFISNGSRSLCVLDGWIDGWWGSLGVFGSRDLGSPGPHHLLCLDQFFASFLLLARGVSLRETFSGYLLPDLGPVLFFFMSDDVRPTT